MIERQVNEIMRLASLLATARVQRFKAYTQNAGKTELGLAEARAQLATHELRDAVRLALSPLREADTPRATAEGLYDTGYDDALRHIRKLMEASCQKLPNSSSSSSTN